MVSPYRGDYVSQEHEDGGGYAGHAGIDLAGPVGRPAHAPYETHDTIHYWRRHNRPRLSAERRPGDTKLW